MKINKTESRPYEYTAAVISHILKGLHENFLCEHKTLTNSQRRAIQLFLKTITRKSISQFINGLPTKKTTGRPKKEILIPIQFKLKDPIMQAGFLALLGSYYPRIIPKCKATLKKFRETNADGGAIDKILNQTRERLRKAGTKWPKSDWAVVRNYLKGLTRKGPPHAGGLARELIRTSSAVKKHYPGITDRYLQVLINKS